MSQPLILWYARTDDMAELLGDHLYKKRITLTHPNMETWAQAGRSLRISLRRISNKLQDGDLRADVIALQAISGPFFECADTKQHGQN